MDKASEGGSGLPRERHIAEPVGVFHDVRFEIQTGSFVTIVAELCIIGLFSRQAAMMYSGGALSDLETALKGALTALRRDSLYRGELGDKMLLSSPPAPISARAILLVGLGEPEAWNPEVAEKAAAIAMLEALRLGVKSAVFAPCLKECGLDSAASAGSSAGVLAGARKALKSRSEEIPKPALRRWIFAEGLEWIDVTLDRLRAAARGIDGRI
jgi:hypothetical protein